MTNIWRCEYRAHVDKTTTADIRAPVDVEGGWSDNKRRTTYGLSLVRESEQREAEGVSGCLFWNKVRSKKANGGKLRETGVASTKLIDDLYPCA